MAIPVIMPRQGQSVESCIITAWNKKVGDTVEKGEILFSYETDKSSFDEPAPESGTLLAIFVSTSDEAVTLLLSQGLWKDFLLLVAVKLVIGCGCGIRKRAVILKQEVVADCGYYRKNNCNYSGDEVHLFLIILGKLAKLRKDNCKKLNNNRCIDVGRYTEGE